jgi:signal transduction histidine kinase
MDETGSGIARVESMFAPKAKERSGESMASLVEVIERFNESSSKLERKHAALMNEVEDLRSKLRSKEEEIKRSERLSMLGETAAALAHEVRNPLGAIALFVSMLKSDLAERPQSLGLVDEIEKSITSLNQVVSNVLHFAKNNRLVLGPVNLHSLVFEAQQHFSGLYGASARIDVNAEGNPYIVADEQALRQCLYNLIINALQITGFSGEVSLSITEDAATDSVSLVVRDNGGGIPNEILPRMFEPFTSGRREGTGLGLSIVKRIIVAHGGVISARNTPGAEFTIVLPRRAVQV